MKIKEFDTIAAIATSFGDSGIGIIRISGEDAFSIAQKIFKPFANDKKEKLIKDYNSHTLTYGTIEDNGEIIDEVLLSVMKAPKTYTCENIVEINCHGGKTSVTRVLQTVLKNGARIAENGEFTKRAFLNGRIDLSKAEAVIDIINSKTELAHKSAVSRLGGKLNEKISEYRNDILTMTAHIEASIDYPEHDDETMTYKTIEENTKNLINKISYLLKTADTGRIVKEGIKTVILGKPNVGKSSILNFLLDEERAIVSNIAGTTRDILKEHININGVALNIIDTAGIRNTEDEIEKIGVLKSKEYAKDADLILLVLDNSKKIDKEDIEILEFIKNKKFIVLINKIDLEKKLEEDKIYNYTEKENVLKLSVKEDLGFENLTEKIEKLFFNGEININEDTLISKERNKKSLYNAIKSLENV
ncbi:MAG: tRNA uridine-5-carboxymethylaminomethyl(34) synthesis GTPase MnmE, partial [Eubacteriales bacterium]|nr:tRNA uridine-5-carboxymethylaminomethyl(34) synthesis GTPase MnmE [Eubacteriales bacterium]